MNFFTNPEVLRKITETDNVINEDLLISKNSKSLINLDLDNNHLSWEHNIFFAATLTAAWHDFYRIIKTNPNKLDRYTPFNQEHIIEYMEFMKGDYLSSKPVFLSNLLRIMFEYYFWSGERPNVAYLSNEDLTELNDIFKSKYQPYVQFDWIRDTLPIALSKWMVTSPAFENAKKLVISVDEKRDALLKDISEKSGLIKAEIESTKTNSLKDVENALGENKEQIISAKEHATKSLEYIENTRKEISALESRIQNLRSEYNFVGLSSGFNKIKEKKEMELKITISTYKKLFGCIFIAPLIITAAHLIFPSTLPKDYSAIFVVLPFFTIEMILIYFFRLSYLEAKSLRTQLIQIELRLSLCSFIDSYVEYRKRNKADIEKVLDSFDSLIFSPIQTNENNIPAMFDGIEAIAGLADKVIKK